LEINWHTPTPSLFRIHQELTLLTAILHKPNPRNSINKRNNASSNFQFRWAILAPRRGKRTRTITIFDRADDWVCYGILTLFCCCVVQPVAAQFGLAGGRKKGGSFQELNEQAKQMQDGTGLQDAGNLGVGMEELAKMMGDIDPKALEEMAGLGPQFDEVMKMMGEMTPEQLEQQMADAMQMLQSGDMMESMRQYQGDILKTLEEAGQIDPEELAKYKTDPEYFEQKMKESFGQMQELFSDPEVLKEASASMQGLSDMFNNPGAMDDMLGELLKDFDDDEKIEEVRQLFLSNPEELGLPGLSEMFDTEEMKAIVNDPVKWRENVKEGQGLLNRGAAAAGGAGVGEL
jgi:hypothetical protein